MEVSGHSYNDRLAHGQVETIAASYVQPGSAGSLRLFNLSPDTKQAGVSLAGKPSPVGDAAILHCHLTVVVCDSLRIRTAIIAGIAAMFREIDSVPPGLQASRWRAASRSPSAASGWRCRRGPA